jgi:drug/metabolite transporter superfamily protein YnfA
MIQQRQKNDVFEHIGAIASMIGMTIIHRT